MTIAVHETTPARDLVPAPLFDRLARRIVTDHGLDRPLAERVMTEALAFLRACAVTDRPLSPSLMVDIGWHTFILYTREYAAVCQQIAGRFLHHVPDDETDADLPADDRGGHQVLRDTIAALTATGHRVDVELWTPVAARCNGGGGKCHQCHAGCHNSPR
ncbi:hypothetical protein Athai_12440 [Actinocatenispora thailandica]|uniref:Uncharacterized protein n=1 Tax=Actinocatenispora thailandica TaxID=227318 RepID=A0A7R7HVL7_9ACTN|nr:hypothetical protein [Actinocatenispora thailandica]BCJ33741.1 hypothetical protein Athai_12440 [Actinocatenispora thailandica]